LEKTKNWTFVCGKVFWNNFRNESKANSNLPCTVPDETTHCRFRNARVKADTYEGLLAEICRRTEGHGLKMKEAAAAIIYATLTGSAAQPLSHIEAPPEDCAENEAPAEPANGIFSAEGTMSVRSRRAARAR
jgi:IS5 family transposase